MSDSQTASYEVLAPGGHANLISDIKEYVSDAITGKPDFDALAPDLTSGASLALIGPTATESTWAQRETDAVDGVAMVDAILGKTVVWNQVVPAFDDTWTTNAVTTSYDQTTNTVTVTSTSDNNIIKRTSKISVAGIAGHKYYMASTVDMSHVSVSNNASIGFNSGSSGVGSLAIAKDTIGRVSGIVEATANSTVIVLRIPASTASGDYVTYKDTIIIDLTRMFGAGNEPSTVAEFEALFPESYYPYDAGSLLSVQLTGVQSTGRNLWGGTVMRDDLLAAGGTGPSADADGNMVAINAATISSKVLCSGPFKENTAYTMILKVRNSNTSTGLNIAFVYTDGIGSILNVPSSTPNVTGTYAFTSDPTRTLVEIRGRNQSGWTAIYYDGSGLFEGYANVSDFMPYAVWQRSIPVDTYFPQGMRSAGTVHDELTADAAVMRVGEVDLGTLTWTYSTTYEMMYATISDAAAGVRLTDSLTCDGYASYPSDTVANLQANMPDKSLSLRATYSILYVKDSAYTDAASFKAAMSGVMLYYAIATPTTTPIDPPLNMSYRVERGGTESVMHTDPTAAPTWRIRYPFDLAAAVMANIAPVEQAVATANHAIGDLLCIGWQLYRATIAIAIGERIIAGTNVTATTVAAELAAIQ